MASFESQETRAIIKYCCQLGYSPTKTYTMIQQASTVKSMSRTQFFAWHQRFRVGQVPLEDEKGRDRKTNHGCDVTAVVSAIKDVFYSDRRDTLLGVCDLTFLFNKTRSVSFRSRIVCFYVRSMDCST